MIDELGASIKNPTILDIKKYIYIMYLSME
jgi:hypothetical protein